MKKRILAILCAILCMFSISVCAFAEKDTTESTSFVFKVDVNERYTDIIDATDDAEYYQLYNNEDEEKQAQAKRNTYIAVLVAALAVSVVVLVVSLKRVPKQEEIDVSGENKIKKDKEE